MALPLPLWIEGHPGMFPGGTQHGGKSAACRPPPGGPGVWAAPSRTMWQPQMDHFSAPVLWLSGFCSEAVGHGTAVAVSESGLGTFVIHVRHEAVL